MSGGSLARRYARALMAIGVEEKNLDTIGSQVGILASVMKSSSELAETLSNPAFPRSDRQNVLVAILDRIGAAIVVKNFTLLLLDRERIAALPDISRELGAMIDQHAGRVKALVTSATALDAGKLAEIESALARLSGKKVEIESKEDPSLLGGVVAKVGDMVYDGSLRTQLSLIRHRLAE